MASPKSSAPQWCFPPRALELADDEVHVWRVSLNQPATQIARFQQTLAADERARAGRFYFDKDRERFVVARGILRAILGFYTHTEPESVSFCYGSHGKPALAMESRASSIRFNISHSGEVGLYAVTRDREIGVDLECIRVGLEVGQIAAQFFSLRENTVLRALPEDLRTRAFLLCWTRKEAYIKARGEGLSMPLGQFDVSLIPGEPAELLSTRPDPLEAGRWSLQELSAAPGFAAALAVEGHGCIVSCWQWPPVHVGAAFQPHPLM